MYTIIYVRKKLTFYCTVSYLSSDNLNLKDLKDIIMYLISFISSG